MFPGMVGHEVYSWYIKCGGIWTAAAIVILAAGGKTITLIGTFFLSSWGAANFKADLKGQPLSKTENLTYLNTYAAILLVGVAILTVRTYCATRHGVKAGGVFHHSMLKHVLGAPIGKINVIILINPSYPHEFNNRIFRHDASG